MSVARYRPDHDVTFDLAHGLVHLEGAPARVLVPADGLAALCAAAGDEATAEIGRAMGRAMGLRVAARLAPLAEAEGATQGGGGARAASIETMVDHLGAELSLAGLGSLGIERWGHALVMVIDHSPLERAATGCSRRSLGEAVGVATGRHVSAVLLARDGTRARLLIDERAGRGARAQLAARRGSRGARRSRGCTRRPRLPGRKLLDFRRGDSVNDAERISALEGLLAKIRKNAGARPPRRAAGRGASVRRACGGGRGGGAGLGGPRRPGLVEAEAHPILLARVKPVSVRPGSPSTLPVEARGPVAAADDRPHAAARRCSMTTTTSRLPLVMPEKKRAAAASAAAPRQVPVRAPEQGPGGARRRAWRRRPLCKRSLRSCSPRSPRLCPSLTQEPLPMRELDRSMPEEDVRPGDIDVDDLTDDDIELRVATSKRDVPMRSAWPSRRSTS